MQRTWIMYTEEELGPKVGPILFVDLSQEESRKALKAMEESGLAFTVIKEKPVDDEVPLLLVNGDVYRGKDILWYAAWVKKHGGRDPFRGYGPKES